MNLMSTRTPAEEALGVTLPNRREEDWKWTDLKRMISGIYTKQTVEVKSADVARLIKSSPFASLKTRRIVFVNGNLDRAHSNLDGLQIESQLPAFISDETVIALNTSLAAEGVSLRFDSNADQPVELLHIVTDGNARAIATRHRIEVAEGASATIIETHIGEGDYLANAVVDYTIADSARLDRIKIEKESTKSTHLSHVMMTLGKGSIVRDVTFTSGAALNRQNGTITFKGEGGNAQVSGAYLLSGTQHADTKLVIDHTVPHCTSRELFKCVMGGKSRGIFQGKAIVRPGAQKTDGKQSSHALLLSETAEFDAKPELEIYADDVVCGHGATSGDLNHDHLFYLKSRGIPEAEARTMLVQAFVSEAFDNVEHEGIREALSALVA